MSHSKAILFMTPVDKPETKSYTKYKSVNDCLDAICKMYEEKLKILSPKAVIITYNINQLFEFIDQMLHLSCFVYQTSTMTYTPYGKEWIKKGIDTLLRSHVTPRSITQANNKT